MFDGLVETKACLRLRLYHRFADRYPEPSESHLSPLIFGSIGIPIGILWFAWTSAPPIHGLLSIAGQVLFDFGFALLCISRHPLQIYIFIHGFLSYHKPEPDLVAPEEKPA